MLDKAKELGQKWLDAFSVSPEQYDAEKALTALQAWCDARGKGEKAHIVANHKEAKKLIARIAPDKIHMAKECFWDYYLMAFYESAMGASGLDHEFTRHSLFESYKAGMFHLLMLGEHQIGVMRPKQVFRGEGNRLHNASGPAIVYDDVSMCKYFWRGTEVPKHFITGKPTVEEALNHENMEVRRCATEILGWETILQAVGAETVSKHEDPHIGELVECEVSGGTRRFLRAKCGTGRMFAMSVPPTVATPMEAQAWIADMPVKNYEEEYRKGYSRT